MEYKGRFALFFTILSLFGLAITCILAAESNNLQKEQNLYVKEGNDSFAQNILILDKLSKEVKNLRKELGKVKRLNKGLENRCILLEIKIANREAISSKPVPIFKRISERKSIEFPKFKGYKTTRRKSGFSSQLKISDP